MRQGQRFQSSHAATVALVCKPSIFENSLRKTNAAYTINNLLGKVDTLFAMPAEKFLAFRINQPQISLNELFDVADDVFCQGVKILLEMTDLKFGNAAFGYGEANSALEAVKLAAKFPTLEEDELKTAQKVFLRLTSGNPLSKSAIDAANQFIKEQLPPEAEFTSRAEVVPLLAEKVFASIICTRK